jgi:Glycosyl hydrolases family 16
MKRRYWVVGPALALLAACSSGSGSLGTLGAGGVAGAADSSGRGGDTIGAGGVMSNAGQAAVAGTHAVGGAAGIGASNVAGSGAIGGDAASAGIGGVGRGGSGNNTEVSAGASGDGGDAGNADGATSGGGGAAGSGTAGTGGTANGGAGSGGAAGTAGSGGGARILTWSDEFNGTDGSAPDSTKWSALVGGDGWGNQERQWDNASSAIVQGGNLVITATKMKPPGSTTCWYGTCQYQSARLQTKGLFSQTYGRFEARIQIPTGQGLWPRWYMLGANIDTVNWPTSGEIDIMENIGKEPSTIHGSVQGPGYAGLSELTGVDTLAAGVKFGDAFHVYAVEWQADVIRFYVDDVLYETQTSADIPAGRQWVFDQPFFLMLDVAIGGTLPGDPDGTTVFPQEMRVDYVRVYQ